MSYDEQPDGDVHGECSAEIARLTRELADAHSRIEELRAHALKYVVPVIDSTVSETEQAIARALDRHGERHSEVHGVYPTLLFSALNTIKALRLARHRASKELATVTRERDEARAEVERLRQFYTAVVPLLEEVMFEHKDAKDLYYNGCDADPCMWCEIGQKAIGAVSAK